jgi:hypothetical protein
MRKLRFRHFFEATDIFGFEPKRAEFSAAGGDLLEKPIRQFNIELMMDLLGKKRLGVFEANVPFLNEIRWGDQPGAIKLEIDTGYTFYIKKLAMDRQGSPRWVTKRMFQLNRQGYGGMEDVVAQEIFEHLQKYSTQNIETPSDSYDGLDGLVGSIYDKIKRTGKAIFYPEGVRKLNDDAYIIKFGVRGQGLESTGHTRVEQNQTMVTYDRSAGTIRVTNYNIKSPVGKRVSWNIYPNDLDLYFFPSQDRDEISETIAVHMKYY